MIATAAVATPSFNARRVFVASLGVFCRRWGTIVTLVTVYWAIGAVQKLTGFAEYRHGSQHLSSFAASEVYAIALTALDCLKNAAIVAVALSPADGRRPLARAVRAALRVFLPLLPFYVLANGPLMLWWGWSDWFLPNTPVSSPLWLGSIFATLVIYDLGLTAFLGLVVPAALVEGGSAFASMRRSAAFLRSGRWRFLGLWVLVNLLNLVIAFIIPIGVDALAFGFANTPLGMREVLRDWFLVGGLIGALVSALWPVVTAVSYQEFRRLHEGAAEDHAADTLA